MAEPPGSTPPPTPPQPQAQPAKKEKKKPEGLVIPPPKPKLSKAERRAIQEAQRAAKEGGAAGSVPGGGSSSDSHKPKPVTEANRSSSINVDKSVRKATGASSPSEENADQGGGGSSSAATQRKTRAKIAQQTLEIIQNKGYKTDIGHQILIVSELDACLAATQLIRPNDFPDLQIRVANKLTMRPQSKPVALTLLAETTLETCRRWVSQDQLPQVCCLNFASAKNPGGGFLGGSQAQEEALSRASALYASLLTQKEYYDFNRKMGTCLYSDHMIWSPNVPIFRDQNDALLGNPYTVSIITAPAVNAGAVLQNERSKASQIGPTMAARAEKVLACAVDRGVENLVLGAWGCGVFANDPELVAQLFMDLLKPSGIYGKAFQRVAFSIPSSGNSAPNFNAFERVFGVR